MTDSKDISNLRRNYTLKELSKSATDNDPFQQFFKWMDEAINASIIEPNAMSVATVSADGIPSIRTVLLKGFDEKGFVFYTNYNSAKAKEIELNPNVSILFFWKELERQVRVKGRAEKTDPHESEVYFNSRPLESRLGAWASEQSSIIAGRELLEQKYAGYKERYKGKEIPLPPFWGGYRIIPSSFEFWQGRTSRLHDRILYTKTGEEWEKVRLQP
jgi:pyridoxamine 5'-phosphate oxidase